ncbi:MAG: hypothetical protein KKB50_10750 [Planctomycetes bacterium]|nr:hypothetical protein [Planctomycetota bacterium]
MTRRAIAWTVLLSVLGCCAAGGLLSACPGLWLAPLQVVAVFDELPRNASVAATCGADTAVPLRVWPLPQRCELTITATGERNPAASVSVVSFTPLIDRNGKPVNPDGYEPGPGWAPWELGERWVAGPQRGHPAAIRWSGHALGTLRLPLVAYPEGGIVTLQWNDEPLRTIDLYSPTETWIVPELPITARRAKLIGRLPFSCERLSLQVNGGEAVCRRVSVIWGQHTLFDRPEDMRIGAERVEIGAPAVRVAQIYAQAAGSALLVLGRALLFVGVSFLLGLPLILLAGGRLSLVERVAAAIVAGTALPTILSITLTRLHCTGSASFWVTLVAGAAVLSGVLLFGGRWRNAGRRSLVPTRREWGVLLGLLALGAVSALLLNYPLLSFPDWFMGHAYTDAYYYINTPAAMRHESISLFREANWRAGSSIGHLIDPGLGYSDRSGDFLSVLNTALLQGTNTRTAYAQLAFNLWFLLPLPAYCLLRRIVAQRLAVWVGVVLVSVSANLYSLFTQCYLAQFLSALLLLHALFAATLYVAEMGREKLTWGQHAGFIGLLAVVLAAAVGTYPPQFLFPVAFALVLVLLALGRRNLRPLYVLAVVGVVTVAAANFGLLPILDAPRDRTPYLAALNGLARNIVFPFYDNPVVFGSIVYGLRDWVNLSPRAPEVLAEALPALADWPARYGHALDVVRRLLLWLCELGAAAGIIISLVRSGTTRVLGVTTVLYALVALLLFRGDQNYLHGKQMITCGLLFLLCLIVGLDALLKVKRWRVGLLGVAVVAGPMLVFNVASAWFDNSVYLLPLHHPVLYQVRTHVMVLNEDLRELDAQDGISAAPVPAGAVAIIGDYARERGTDRDRVLMEHVHHVFRGYRVLHNPSAAVWAAHRPAWALVFEGFELPAAQRATGRLAFANSTFALYQVDPVGSASSAPAAGAGG